MNIGATIYDDHDVEPRVSRDRRDAERRTEYIGEPVRHAVKVTDLPLAAGFVRVQILEIARQLTRRPLDAAVNPSKLSIVLRDIVTVDLCKRSAESLAYEPKTADSQTRRAHISDRYTDFAVSSKPGSSRHDLTVRSKKVSTLSTQRKPN